MLNIENNDPFSAFSLILSYLINLPNLVTHLIITSFKITKENKFRPPNPLISLVENENFQAYTYPYFAKH
jgi:hypothetical protein